MTILVLFNAILIAAMSVILHRHLKSDLPRFVHSSWGDETKPTYPAIMILITVFFPALFIHGVFLGIEAAIKAPAIELSWHEVALAGIVSVMSFCLAFRNDFRRRRPDDHQSICFMNMAGVSVLTIFTLLPYVVMR